MADQPQAPAPTTEEPDLFAGAQASPGAAQAASPAPAATPVATAPAPQPVASPEAPGGGGGEDPLGSSVTMGEPTLDPSQIGPIASPLDTAGAVGAGAAKAVFAAKDFFASGMGMFTPPTLPGEKAARDAIDAYSANQSAKWGAGASLTQGIGQVAVGLLGAEAGGAGALGALGRTAVDTLAATASFEPHAQNLANLASQVPGLSGPMTTFLASSPADSDSMGYLKNALTSLGLSATIVGTFVGASLMVKALKGGDAAAISSASADLEKALGEHVQSLTQPKPTEGEVPSPTSPISTEPSSSQPSSAGQPTATPGEPSGEQPPGQTLGPTSSEASGSPSSSPSSSGAPGAPSFTLDEEQFSRFIAGSQADQDAFLQHGSWDDAIAAGHEFASEDKIPWQVIGSAPAMSEEGGQATSALDAFIARTSEAFREPLDMVKGGAVQTDAMTQKAVDTRVKLWGEDRATLLGEMQAAGARAGDLRADMMGSFTIAQRALQDSWALSQRIKLGDFSDYAGNEAAAMAALKDHVITSMRLFGAAQSIRANVGRAMRGLRSEFQLGPEAVRAVASLDPQEMLSVMDATNGDPRALAEIAKPDLWSRVAEGAQLLLVNNLISSVTTHAVIIGSNLFQAISRPGMRMAGSLLNGTADTVGAAAKAQYWYTGASVMDAFHSAVQAFKVGDSIIAPHDVDAAMGLGSGGPNAGASGLGQMISQLQFGPWDNVGDILRNVLTAGAKTGIFPSRFVGFQDELVKQSVYRGVIQSRAFVEGQQMGLAAQDLEQYVKDKLFSAFDQFGRGTDVSALQEAKIATYQNDLNATGTFGWGTQGAKTQQYLQNNPPARIILPFLRTPVNLFRQSVQLTPGLNMLQKEYRDMINGVMGPSSQAQAIGQMGMGALLMGAMGTVAHYGYVTGDAPDNTRLKGEALQDGWKPNSIVFAHPDGSRTYVPYDRYDPIMMPMAMAANIVSVLQSPEVADQRKAEGMLQALGVVLVHQLTDKLYLQNFQKTLEAVVDPERTLPKWLGSMAGNYLPFSSALHLANGMAIDPYVRQADGFVSAALSKVPGFSKDFQPRRDWAGDPITIHPGLWSNVPGGQANDEVNRLATQQGGAVGPPSSRASGGADLRGVTMAGNEDPTAAGRDAYDYYQEKSGHPDGAPSLRDTISKLIANPRYQMSPDGAADTPGTKLSALTDTMHKYRSNAMKWVSADLNVRNAEKEEIRRVAVARGQAAAPNPTPTNALTGVLKNLGARVGLGGLAAPSPVQQGGQ